MAHVKHLHDGWIELLDGLNEEEKEEHMQPRNDGGMEWWDGLNKEETAKQPLFSMTDKANKEGRNGRGLAGKQASSSLDEQLHQKLKQFLEKASKLLM